MLKSLKKCCKNAQKSPYFQFFLLLCIFIHIKLYAQQRPTAYLNPSEVLSNVVDSTSTPSALRVISISSASPVYVVFSATQPVDIARQSKDFLDVRITTFPFAFPVDINSQSIDLIISSISPVLVYSTIPLTAQIILSTITLEEQTFLPISELKNYGEILAQSNKIIFSTNFVNEAYLDSFILRIATRTSTIVNGDNIYLIVKIDDIVSSSFTFYQLGTRLFNDTVGASFQKKGFGFISRTASDTVLVRVFEPEIKIKSLQVEITTTYDTSFANIPATNNYILVEYRKKK